MADWVVLPALVLLTLLDGERSTQAQLHLGARDVRNPVGIRRLKDGDFRCGPIGIRFEVLDADVTLAS